MLKLINFEESSWKVEIFSKMTRQKIVSDAGKTKDKKEVKNR